MKAKYFPLMSLAGGVAIIAVFAVSGQSQLTGGPGSLTSGWIQYEPPGNSSCATEAPTGFDINDNNGFMAGTFAANRQTFEEVENIADGLGPTYNAQACRECHQNVITGGSSQVTEVRTVRLTAGIYFASMSGSVLQARATNPEIVEHVMPQDTVRAKRQSPSVLGDGFVECIANSTLQAIRDSQPWGMRGRTTIVPVDEANGQVRIGRFGWKSQHASLISFAADAYLNEMGITSPLHPDENLSDGRYVGFGTPFDPVPDPEDKPGPGDAFVGVDVFAFGSFMRGTEAPSRGPITSSVLAGEQVFKQIGCSICHVPKIITAPPGTRINGGAFTVPPQLGNKIIHPYSDFLLHDIGTGDGIPIQPTPDYAYSANRMRTAPLWGLRTRNRLLHDAQVLTYSECVQAHGGEAAGVVARFYALDLVKQQNLYAFLGSL